MSLALSIGLLAAAGVFLVLQRGMIRIILGFVLLTHAVNLLIIAAGGVARRGTPFIGGDTSVAADPLPQAFVLTAIVIAFAITVVLATLAVVGRSDDDTEGEPTRSTLPAGKTPKVSDGDLT
jgi:multicomponent Na+:H+ antiporter subunit C